MKHAHLQKNTVKQNLDIVCGILCRMLHKTYVPVGYPLLVAPRAPSLSPGHEDNTDNRNTLQA